MIFEMYLPRVTRIRFASMISCTIGWVFGTPDGTLSVTRSADTSSTITKIGVKRCALGMSSQFTYPESARTFARRWPSS